MADNEKKLAEETKETPTAPPGSPSPEAATTGEVIEDEKARKFTWVDNQGAKLNLNIRRPTGEEVQASDWEYARIFNEAIQEGIIPRAALISILQERGINFDKQQEEVTVMQDELNALITELEEVRKKEDKGKVTEVKDDIKDLRDKLIVKRTAISDYTRNCAESMANDARDVFVLATILEKDGESFFNSKQIGTRQAMRERLKKFQKDEYTTLRLQGSYEFMTFANGLPSNFMEQFPERQSEKWETTTKGKQKAASK